MVAAELSRKHWKTAKHCTRTRGYALETDDGLERCRAHGEGESLLSIKIIIININKKGSQNTEKMITYKHTVFMFESLLEALICSVIALMPGWCKKWVDKTCVKILLQIKQVS